MKHDEMPNQPRSLLELNEAREKRVERNVLLLAMGVPAVVLGIVMGLITGSGLTAITVGFMYSAAVGGFYGLCKIAHYIADFGYEPAGNKTIKESKHE
jgi:hypothetical protein